MTTAVVIAAALVLRAVKEAQAAPEDAAMKTALAVIAPVVRAPADPLDLEGPAPAVLVGKVTAELSAASPGGKLQPRSRSSTLLWFPTKRVWSRWRGRFA